MKNLIETDEELDRAMKVKKLIKGNRVRSEKNRGCERDGTIAIT